MNRFWRSALLSVLLPVPGAAVVPGRGLPHLPPTTPPIFSHAAAPIWIAAPSGLPPIASPLSWTQPLWAPASVNPAAAAVSWSPAPAHVLQGPSAPQVLSTFYDGRKSQNSAVGVDASLSAEQPISGARLFKILHKQSGQGYKKGSYQDGEHFMFSTADNVVRTDKQGQSVRGIVDVYSGTFVPGQGDRGSNYVDKTRKDSLNGEHVWPQSLSAPSHGRRILPRNADVHNLAPVFMQLNTKRSSLPLGEVTGKPKYSDPGGAKVGEGVFEPPDASKGRITRAILYFHTRYYKHYVISPEDYERFFRSRIEMFLRWNREHPPTDEEKRRNDLIAKKFQGNRNPFIDDHALADQVGAEGFLSHPPAHLTDTEALRIANMGARAFAKYSQKKMLPKPKDPAALADWNTSQLRNYFELMGRFSSALGQDAAFIYPLMGPDAIPALARRTFPLENSPENFEHGRNVVAQLLGSKKFRPRRKLLTKKTFDVHDWEKYAPEVQALSGRRVLLIKEFKRDLRDNAQPLFAQMLQELLRPGDMVLILRSKDLPLRGALASQGFERIVQGPPLTDPQEALWAAYGTKPEQAISLPSAFDLWIKR